MSALWSRGETRDYIDIAVVLNSGRFGREEVLAIADQLEATPLDRQMLAVRFREADRHNEARFARYGVDAGERTQIIKQFAAWADEIDPQ